MLRSAALMLVVVLDALAQASNTDQNTITTEAANAPIVTFEKMGVIDYKTYESTPVVFNGRQLLMETVTLTYPRHISRWIPGFSNCSSYFRVRDLNTGQILSNLTSSCNHSFGSAFVDKLPNGTEVLWIFGTAWWRPVLARAREAEAGWSGDCSGANCTLGAFWTKDFMLEKWQYQVALRPGRSTWNVGVALGKPATNGARTYVMAAEQQPLPGAPTGSSWTSYFYVNENQNGDLTSGWKLLAPSNYVVGGPGTHGACPSIRFVSDEEGGWFYLVSGGLSVYLDRSRDLSKWEPSSQQGIVLQASLDDYSQRYKWYVPTLAEQKLLDDAVWDVDASDVDMWEMNDGTTLFVYLFGNQRNIIFSALGRYNGSMASWFAKQFSVDNLAPYGKLLI